MWVFTLCCPAQLISSTSSYALCLLLQCLGYVLLSWSDGPLETELDLSLSSLEGEATEGGCGERGAGE